MGKLIMISDYHDTGQLLLEEKLFLDRQNASSTLSSPRKISEVHDSWMAVFMRHKTGIPPLVCGNHDFKEIQYLVCFSLFLNSVKLSISLRDDLSLVSPICEEEALAVTKSCDFLWVYLL